MHFPLRKIHNGKFKLCWCDCVLGCTNALYTTHTHTNTRMSKREFGFVWELYCRWFLILKKHGRRLNWLESVYVIWIKIKKNSKIL